MTSAQITKTFNGTPFVFRADGWFNMTKAAQHFGKRLQDFLDNKETREYSEALSSIDANQRELVQANRGRYGGTWAHPKLAVFFARWLDLRVIDRNGEPWFVAKDVCEALGMNTAKTGTGMWLAGLDDDEKQSIGKPNACGLHPQSSIINESGLYSLILKSKKPEARAFKKWVTSEVLPTIRKTGGYMAR